MKFILVLGNGFSIDFVKSCMPSFANIDTGNLFSKGAAVPAPGRVQYGFLSAKHTPSLWALNARPYVDAAESMRIFEEIMSAAQAYFGHDKKKAFLGADGLRSTHLRAYCELSYYLRSLFIRYDKQRNQMRKVSDWPWAKFLECLHKRSDIDEVIVVTYNYDLWLERVLTHLGIDFHYALSSDPSGKFVLYKPHGSINFISTRQQVADRDEEEISYTLEVQDIPEEVKAISDNFESYWTKYTLVPPAGDSSRLGARWNGVLRQNLLEKLGSMNDATHTVISGLSYWHVDRGEIDEVLCSINPDSEVLMINPHPPGNLDAVLTTVFSNYTCFLGSEILTEVINELQT
jgi:hypothetical protein